MYLASDRWSDFTVLQSTFHEAWMRKYSGALKNDIRYLPTNCFLTFAFPEANRDWRITNGEHAVNSLLAIRHSLDLIGESYHEYRRTLMGDLWLGLTDLYNLFHAPDLEQRLTALFDKRTAKGEWQVAEGVPTDHKPLDLHHSPAEALQGIQRLRDLHRELDQTVLTAYGWHTESDFGPALALRHDFYDVDYLPENDRTRYTIHPDARRELLARLLKLNHVRAAEAESAAKVSLSEPKKRTKIKQPAVSSTPELDLGLIDLRLDQTAKIKPKKQAGYEMFAQAYPSTTADRLVCALALDIFAWKESIASSDHLDALILACHPTLCQKLMAEGHQTQLAKWIAPVKKELTVIGRQGIRWVECLNYLEKQRYALVIERDAKDRPIRKGASFQSVLKSFPGAPQALIPMALSVVDSLIERRTNNTLSQEQVVAVKSIEKLHTLAWESGA